MRIDRSDYYPSDEEGAEDSIYIRFDHPDHGWFQRRLKIDPDKWFDSEAILNALRWNSREPLPEELTEYLRRRLEGDVRRPKGRRPKGKQGELRHFLIRLLYRRNLDWLEARRKSAGLEGWTLIRDAEWWQGPPSERAARMVKARYARSITWQRVRQIALGD